MPSGCFVSPDGDSKCLKDMSSIDQSDIWDFQVSAVMGPQNPTVCLLLDLSLTSLNLTGYENFFLNITTRENTLKGYGYFVEATERYDVNYETRPTESGGHFYVSVKIAFCLLRKSHIHIHIGISTYQIVIFTCNIIHIVIGSSSKK